MFRRFVGVITVSVLYWSCSESCQCGHTPIQPQLDSTFKVVGGKVAKPFSWPWQVLVKNMSDHQDICGGTLIDPEWVMSAKHCPIIAYQVYNRTHLTLQLGVFNRSQNEAGVQTYVIDVFDTGTVIHPTLDYFTSPDIILYKLDPPAKLSFHVQPICLAKDDSTITPGTSMYVTGWGKTTKHPKEKHPEEYSKVLRQAKVEVLGSDSCSYEPKFNQSFQFCVGNDQKDSCHGDSGGPLVIQNPTSKLWYQCAAVSYGPDYACAKTGHPGLVTRTAGVCDWLQAETGKAICRD